MEALVAEKKRVIIVGGMDFNIPPQLKEHFEIVKHITQESSRYNSIPQADYIFVFAQWSKHNVVEQVKHDAPTIPLIRLRMGWASMKTDLQQRCILPPDEQAKPEEAVSTPQEPAAPPPTLGLSEDEIWKKFGEKMIDACRGALKLGEKVSKKELLDVMSMAGPPAEDCELFLPKLQMFGVIAPTKDDRWRLASSDSQEYEDQEEGEAVAQASSRSRKSKKVEPEDRTEAEDRLRRIPGTPSLGVRLIAALNPGPYLSKRAIYKEMRKYKEFAGFTDHQIWGLVERAIKLKIIDDTRKDLYINHRDECALTKRDDLPLEKEAEAQISAVKASATQLQLELPPPPPKGLSPEEAQKKWCFAVERIRQYRLRLGDVLVHCRIEWMSGNNVLVIFIPAALSACQKFVESTENWGVITQYIQESFTKDTVIRIMLDNGLRT